MVKILVIEDDLEIRTNLLELLTVEGFNVVGAEDGVTGLLGALEQHPDLILCDVMMPELDGYDVLQAIRQEPQTATIPFIFLTALADKADIRQGMNLGADDYLSKPFTRAEVLEIINIRLAKQAAANQQYQQAKAQADRLQRELRQFQESLTQDQETLLSDIYLQLRESITKLGIATQILKQVEDSEQRERSLALIQSVCAAEIKLLNRIPNLAPMAQCS
jgi:CheY-like chemotaxis protein